MFGVKRINKRAARKLWEANAPFIVAGDKVNEYHILHGWVLGCPIDPQRYKDAGHPWTFDDMLNNFMFYCEPELGRRPAYYVKTNGGMTQ